MFYETTYVNEQNGQTYPMYLMNRDGFSLLAMGFSKRPSESHFKPHKYYMMYMYMNKRINPLRNDSDASDGIFYNRHNP